MKTIYTLIAALLCCYALNAQETYPLSKADNGEMQVTGKWDITGMQKNIIYYRLGGAFKGIFGGRDGSVEVSVNQCISDSLYVASASFVTKIRVNPLIGTGYASNLEVKAVFLFNGKGEVEFSFGNLAVLDYKAGLANSSERNTVSKILHDIDVYKSQIDQMPKKEKRDAENFIKDRQETIDKALQELNTRIGKLKESIIY